MPCEIGTNVIICGPPRGVYKRREAQDCPECDDQHGFVVRWDGAWYGQTLYGACGDTWQDGFRMERPFQRGWRKKAQQEFQQMWDHAVPDELYGRYVDADVMVYAPDVDEDAALTEVQAAHEAILAFHANRSFRPERGAE